MSAYVMLFFHESYGLVEWQFGLIAAGCAFMFVLASALADALEKAVGAPTAFLSGFSISATGFFLLGDGFSLPFWCAMGAYYVLFLGIAFASILGPPTLLKTAQAADFKLEDASVQSATLTIFMTGAAQAIAPPAGGMIADRFGAASANTYGGAAILAIGLTQAVLLKAFSRKTHPSASMV